MTIDPQSVAAVEAAITSRRCVRAYLPTAVPRQTLEHLLELAARAPSGTNTQPWRVYVLTGAAKQALTRDIRAAFDDPQERARHTEEYAYYPQEWRSPYVDRRRKLGWDPVSYTHLDVYKRQDFTSATALSLPAGAFLTALSTRAITFFWLSAMPASAALVTSAFAPAMMSYR